MIQSFAALALVLGLTLGLTWVLKRLRVGMPALGDAGRMRLVATLPLDMKHRAVIISVDGIEHVVILGGTQPVICAQTKVIEHGK